MHEVPTCRYFEWLGAFLTLTTLASCQGSAPKERSITLEGSLMGNFVDNLEVKRNERICNKKRNFGVPYKSIKAMDM